jgi:hypothetical protein
VSDIQAVLKLAREAYPQVPDLIEQQTASLRSYLAGLSPLPPPTLVPLPAFVAHTLPTIKRVDDPIGGERWWRQHLDHVCSVNERLLAHGGSEASGARHSADDSGVWIPFASGSELTNLTAPEISRQCRLGKIRFQGKGRGRKIHAIDLMKCMKEREERRK